jgi:transposase
MTNENYRKLRARNPEAASLLCKENRHKLYKRHNVTSIKQLYIKKYSSPDYIPTEQEKKWIEILAKNFFEEGQRVRKNIVAAEKGLTDDRAYYLTQTKMYTDLLVLYQNDFMTQAMVEICEDVQNKTYEKAQKSFTLKKI